MNRKLNESDIRKIVKKVIHERDEDLEMIKGISYNENTELVDDVISIITVYSSKLYGSRSNKNKKAIEESKKIFSTNE